MDTKIAIVFEFHPGGTLEKLVKERQRTGEGPLCYDMTICICKRVLLWRAYCFSAFYFFQFRIEALRFNTNFNQPFKSRSWDTPGAGFLRIKVINSKQTKCLRRLCTCVAFGFLVPWVSLHMRRFLVWENRKRFPLKCFTLFWSAKLNLFSLSVSCAIWRNDGGAPPLTHTHTPHFRPKSHNARAFGARARFLYLWYVVIKSAL